MKIAIKLLLPLAGILTLAACGDSDNVTSATKQSYKVTVKNLTENQPLSPLAVLVHGASYKMFTPGGKASEGLEKLAEGGETASLIAEASSVMGSATGSGPIGPGSEESVTVAINSSSDIHLSLASMLVNTNDAFVTLTGQTLAMAVGETKSYRAGAWDAGTEANSESAGSMPGPADGGEGFNAARNDVDFIHIHPGVVSADDGLASSVLDQSHKWDNPVINVTVERLE